MKRALLIIGFFLLVIATNAQTTPAPKRVSYHLTDQSIVKDSTGHVLAITEWKAMMKSGDYMFHPEQPGDTTKYILQKLTAQQKQAREEARKAGKPFSISFAGSSYTRRVDEKNMMVKDSAGHILPNNIWGPMVRDGEYTLVKSTLTQDTAYYLKRASAEEKQRRLRMLASIKPPESKFFTTGQPLTPFEVTDINGKKITTADWAGKTVVLCFWYSTWSGTEKMVNDLNNLVAKYHDNPKVLFIGLALDQDSELKNFNETIPFNYRLVPNGRPISRSLNVALFPTHVIVNRKGNITFHTSGMPINTVSWMGKAIDESETGK